MTTKFRFSHYGTARRWFWWGVLPLLNLMLVAMIWNDWRTSGFGREFQTDVFALVFVNVLLPLVAMGDRLSPKVVFDWNRRILSVPPIGGIQSIGLGYQQQAREIPFGEIKAVVVHTVRLRNADVEFDRKVVQVLTQDPSGTSAELLAAGGMIAVYNQVAGQPASTEGLFAALQRANAPTPVTYSDRILQG